jgi:hypothetical protein
MRGSSILFQLRVIADANRPVEQYSIRPPGAILTGNKRVTVPQSAFARFYRIGWTSQVRITGISLTGGNIVLSYQ